MAREKRENGAGTKIKQMKDKDGNLGLWCQRLTINGNRTAFYGKTQNEVMEKVKDANKKILTNTYAAPTKTTLYEWVRKWLDDYKKINMRETTWSSYDTMLEKHIKDSTIANIKLSKLQTGDLQKLYKSKLESGRADKKEGGLSGRTVRYIHQVIHGSLEQALKEKLVGVNVAKGAELPKSIKPKIKSMDTEKITQFLNAAKQSRFYLAFLLTLSTGMRRGEVLGLHWEDVDFKNNTIFINRQVITTNDGPKLVLWTKTGTSTRINEISEDIIKELKTIRQAKGLIFPNELGEIMNPNNFVRNFKAALKRAGLKGYSYHSLRHSFAILQMEAGVSVNVVQEALGHTDASTTSDIYQEATKKMKKQAANVIGDILKGCINE
jgi:integrase